MTASSRTRVEQLRGRPRTLGVALLLLVGALAAAVALGVGTGGTTGPGLPGGLGSPGGLDGAGGSGSSSDAPTTPGTARAAPTPAPDPAVRGAARDPARDPAGAAAPMRRSVPDRLRIPAIGVDSSLLDLGLLPDGTLETPPGAFPAGWFSGSPTPGETGPAIIAGHVRYVTPGVFARLAELGPGDRIDVVRRDGSTARFAVTELVRVDKSAFPTQQVYGDIDRPGLRLITCGGLDPERNEYDENVVVFADLIPA